MSKKKATRKKSSGSKSGKAPAPAKRVSGKKGAAKPARRSSKSAPARGASPRKAARKSSPAGKAGTTSTSHGSVAPRAVADQVIAFLRFAAATSDAQLNALPDEHALAQLQGADNHLAWTLGHQALSRAWFASSISGQMPPIPERYNALFGSKSSPSTDPALYPSLDELRRHYSASLHALIASAEALRDEDLSKPAHGDSGGWLTTRLDAILKAGWHEGWHGAQIATLRRGLGLPPLM